MAHSTPFSFHCMVCFEEFHPEERYPVVLPCGHTYVCNCCANRLDKCMECRTPLYTIVPNKTGQNHNPQYPSSSHQAARSSWANSRVAARNTADTTPPTPPIKKRLALPKNVVLLSLIEATELASEDARKKYCESPYGNRKSMELDGAVSVPNLHSMGSMIDAVDDEEEEEERIRICTSLAVGVAGTYAVAVKDGLEIFSSRPSRKSVGAGAIDARDEDVESLVRCYNAEQMDDGEGTPNSRKSRDPLRLCFGDRVQIVSFDEGWAKLARGYGFVKADQNQLVKVGGSVDRACKLEAILFSLSNRRKELRIEQNKVDNQFIRYMNDLQHSLQNDEDLTVILADTFSPMTAEMLEPGVIETTEQSTSAARDNEWDDRSTHSFVCKPSPPDRPSTPPLQSTRASRFTCFSSGVFGGGDDSGSTESTTKEVRRKSPETSSVALFPNSTHPSHSAMKAGAQAWRERHGRPQAADTGIDFRTGMSGHMALLSSHANSHKYLEPSYQPSKPSRMSSHAGLGVTMQSLTGILNSLTLPVIGTTPPRRTEREGIRQNGSM